MYEVEDISVFYTEFVCQTIKMTKDQHLTSNSYSLCQTQSDRLTICIMKLCHSLRVPVYLGQEHALAAGI